MEESATEREPFSRYYARYLVAKRGYRLGALPQSEELLQHCDYVLTRSAGNRISIVGIVNCDSAEGKIFTMPAQGLSALAQHIVGALPASVKLAITIYEIGSRAIGRTDKSRLSGHKSGGGRHAHQSDRRRRFQAPRLALALVRTQVQPCRADAEAASCAPVVRSGIGDSGAGGQVGKANLRMGADGSPAGGFHC